MKKILPWVVLILVVFFIVRNPNGAATFAHRLGNGIVSVADALGRFFTSLVS